MGLNPCQGRKKKFSHVRCPVSLAVYRAKAHKEILPEAYFMYDIFS